ncbi:MAG: ABC transporter permease [Lachnospiraceae bacterium]|nr:ABC transporter permease [Lachnospiraceae bacterium]
MTALLDDLQNDSGIETVLKYTVGTVTIGDAPVTVFACENFSKVSNDLCYLGENPDDKNEIALGSTFEEKYKPEDQIEIQNGDISYSYEITGFVQSVNYQGNICEFSMEGYEALHPETIVPSLYVYLQNGIDARKVIEEIGESYGDKIAKQVNYQKMTETTREMYSGITSIIVIVIFALTILIVLFVLYIVIKTLLVQRKQELGIYKAIGYSNWQLTVQMLGSFLPSSILAVLLSAVLGFIYVPLINRFIFRSIGAMKNHMEVSFAFLMIFALIQIAVNLIISISLTKPVRKISAYALIKDD